MEIKSDLGHGGSRLNTGLKDLLDAIVDSMHSIIKTLGKTDVTNETLTDAGDQTTYYFENDNVIEGTVVVYEDTGGGFLDVTGPVDVTNDIASIEYAYDNEVAQASVTFTSARTGTITADYSYVENMPSITIEKE